MIEIFRALPVFDPLFPVAIPVKDRNPEITACPEALQRSASGRIRWQDILITS